MTMTLPLPDSYEEIPYTSRPFVQTHPDRLATIATLLGMDPPPVAACRVLELGCAGGGNLIPMALTLPHSEFVGLDLSARQIAEGQTVIKSLGLGNITLSQMDIMDIDHRLGQFDYIIAHGVFSWTPRPVQEKILAVCREHLSPNGVAYISYNTYPGWRLHEAVREMMLYHTRNITDPQTRIDQARALLDFLADSILAQSTPHASFLHSYVHYVRDRFVPEEDDAYLFHNELAQVNEPLYFYQFVERAANHGLKYLAEAQFQTMLAHHLPASVLSRLREMAKSTVELEQYMDFLRNRTFRQTLLCHQEVALQSKLPPERLARFYVASSALPDPVDTTIPDNQPVTFRGPKGDVMTTDHPVTQAAMLILSRQWPQAVSFDALYRAAFTSVYGRPPDEPSPLEMDRQLLGANLLQAYGYNDDLVELHISPSPFSCRVTDHPVASPLARYQAANGADIITNLRHENIKLEGINYLLLPLLDGHHSPADLVDWLSTRLQTGEVSLNPDDQIRRELGENHWLPQIVNDALQTIASAALLMGEPDEPDPL
ncbi:MAG: methyltransferase domain-containing protein [Chloroflexi bacterium]|nr:MAG: methyltransferase domain-containing protein [Chloroflexota bacterium]